MERVGSVHSGRAPGRPRREGRGRVPPAASLVPQGCVVDDTQAPRKWSGIHANIRAISSANLLGLPKGSSKRLVAVPSEEAVS